MRSKGPSPRRQWEKRALSQSTSGCLTRRAAASSRLTVCIETTGGVCGSPHPGRAGRRPPGCSAGTGPSGGTARIDTKTSAEAAPRPTALRAPGDTGLGRAPLPPRGCPGANTAGPGMRAGPARCRPRFSLSRFPQATSGRGFVWDFRKSEGSTVYRLLFVCVCVGICRFSFPPQRGVCRRAGSGRGISAAPRWSHKSQRGVEGGERRSSNCETQRNRKCKEGHVGSASE